MTAIPKKCEDINSVASFCECIGVEESVDVAAKAFCRRAAENSSSVTGDELVELKKALKDLDEPAPGRCGC